MSAWASAHARAVRRAVFVTLAAQGRAPSIAELGAQLALDVGSVARALRELHDAHALVLTAAGDAIRMAHPFSAAPMGFVLRDGDSFWWGGCAWDSFGVVAALGRELEITTVCAGCGHKLVYTASADTPPTLSGAVARIPHPARAWWDDVVATCSAIRVFCDPAEVPAGEVAVPLEALWRLALPWYGDRLDENWAPQSTEHRQRLLDEAGLTGGFWALPAD